MAVPVMTRFVLVFMVPGKTPNELPFEIVEATAGLIRVRPLQCLGQVKGKVNRHQRVDGKR